MKNIFLSEINKKMQILYYFGAGLDFEFLLIPELKKYDRIIMCDTLPNNQSWADIQVETWRQESVDNNTPKKLCLNIKRALKNHNLINEHVQLFHDKDSNVISALLKDGRLLIYRYNTSYCEIHYEDSENNGMFLHSVTCILETDPEFVEYIESSDFKLYARECECCEELMCPKLEEIIERPIIRVCDV